jgi:hypothetical protein
MSTQARPNPARARRAARGGKSRESVRGGGWVPEGVRASPTRLTWARESRRSLAATLGHGGRLWVGARRATAAGAVTRASARADAARAAAAGRGDAVAHPVAAQHARPLRHVQRRRHAPAGARAGHAHSAGRLLDWFVETRGCSCTACYPQRVLFGVKGWLTSTCLCTHAYSLRVRQVSGAKGAGRVGAYRAVPPPAAAVRRWSSGGAAGVQPGRVCAAAVRRRASGGAAGAQMVMPALRSDSALITFRRKLEKFDFDLRAWRVDQARPSAASPCGLPHTNQMHVACVPLRRGCSSQGAFEPPGVLSGCVCGL